MGSGLAYTLFLKGRCGAATSQEPSGYSSLFHPRVRFYRDGRRMENNRLHGYDGQRSLDNLCDPAQGGVARHLIPGNDETADATWTPDNKSIVFGPWKGGESRGIKVLDLNTHQVSPLPGATEMWSPRTSPNGRYIAALSEQDSKMNVV